MCGHVSIYFKKDRSEEEKRELMKSLTDKIYHRGPNDEGFYSNDKVNFGFRRLSIIDLECGHQPFEKGDCTMIFNGEIYNHNEIRASLKEKGHEFSTHSDTEALLTSYLDKGEGCLDELRGMYAFLIHDTKKNKIFGARDIFGIKPLYYIDNDEMIAFASEYKTLVGLLEETNVNRDSLQVYLSFQYVQGEETMMEDIKVLKPGHCFTIEDDKLTIKKYFEARFNPTGDVTAKDIHDVMVDSVSKHMIADVEVGTFLSGGIDSTIIATLASKINPKIKSFTVGFGVPGYDECTVAKKTAEAIGIENIDIVVSQQEYIKALPDFVEKLDDPLADPSAMGIYFLSKEASKHVRVVLSGEGADELFGGYVIYQEYYSVKPFLNAPQFLKNIVNRMAKMMPEIKGKSYLLRATTDLEDRYIGNAKIFDNDEVQKVAKNYKEENRYEKHIKEVYNAAKGYDYVSKMQHVDINTWLEGDILLKGDKMSMASSLEVRVPFMDKEVLKVASKLTLEQKVERNNSKVLMREAFDGIVPQHIVQKKKLGFPTPIRVWLKDELGVVARKTIMEAEVSDLINKEYAINLLDEHIAEKKDNSRKVWTIFIFCLWHQIFIEKKKIEF